MADWVDDRHINSLKSVNRCSLWRLWGLNGIKFKYKVSSAANEMYTYYFVC